MRSKMRLVLIVVLLWVVGILVVAPITRLSFYRIPSAAMEPTLKKGDCVITESITYLFQSPKRNDIAVFHVKGIPNPDTDTLFEKRIIGLPGEEIAIKNGNVYIDNNLLITPSSKYTNPPSSTFLSSPLDTFKIPQNSYFVLGDNSKESFDSRYFGPISKAAIVSRVIFRYWPLNRVGFVNGDEHGVAANP